MDDEKFNVDVRVFDGSFNRPPHAFIVLFDEFGNKQGFGFAPSADLDLWGPGKIFDDTEDP